jgi:hypothetical protein
MTKTVYTTKSNVRVYLSDGSDGYVRGTYGYVVDLEQYDGLHTWTDGGYASADHALESARKCASRARA